MAKTAKSGKANRQQVAVVPVRRNAEGATEVMLVTSRGTGRYIVPKGWSMPNKSLRQAAEIEAWEEAGLKGSVGSKPIGTFSYGKRMGTEVVPVDVIVFRMDVERQKSSWPEAGQRRCMWLPAGEAASLVEEAELGDIIRAFDETEATA